MNLVALIGNLGNDPSLRYTPNGNPVCDFSIAVDEVNGGGNKKTNWFNVRTFGKVAEASSQYLAKGKKVAINGRLTQDNWETEDGEKRSIIRIIANEVNFLSPKSQNDNEPF